MALKKIAVCSVIVALILCLTIAYLSQPALRPRPIDNDSDEIPEEPQEEPVELIDSDGDGFSDDFEINIAGTDPLIPNNRYALLFKASHNITTVPESIIEKHNWPYREEEEMIEFLLNARVSPENIVSLFFLEATKRNLIAELERLSQKITENDIFIFSIMAHGDNEAFYPHRQGLTADKINYISKAEVFDQRRGEIIEAFPYPELNQHLEKIKARTTIVYIRACGSEHPDVFNALRKNNRVIIAPPMSGHLLDLIIVLGYQPQSPRDEQSFRWVFEPHPGIVIGMYSPRQEWFVNNYNSTVEVLQDIDKDGNGYISLYEALSWIKKMRNAEDEITNKRILQENPNAIFTSYEGLKTTNLEILKNIYLNEYWPRELKELS